MEVTACKFRAIVMYDTMRAGIKTQPVAVEEDADVVATFIFLSGQILASLLLCQSEVRDRVLCGETFFLLLYQ